MNAMFMQELLHTLRVYNSLAPPGKWNLLSFIHSFVRSFVLGGGWRVATVTITHSVPSVRSARNIYCFAGCCSLCNCFCFRKPRTTALHETKTGMSTMKFHLSKPCRSNRGVSAVPALFGLMQLLMMGSAD